MKKRTLIILLLVVLLVLVNMKPMPALKNKKTSSEQKIEPEHPQEYYDELVERGVQLDNLTMGNPHYPFYEKINFKEDKKNRKKILEEVKMIHKKRRLDGDSQTLSNLGFVDLFQKGDYSSELRALRFLMNYVKKEESKFILYPYPFFYKDQLEAIKKVEYGGFFALNQTSLNGGNFNYIQNISSVQLGKAKGIYDIDIAILSIVYLYNGRETDLFAEANSYCEYFVNLVTKTSSCLDGKSNYLDYKLNYPHKGAVVRVSDKDITDNILYDPETYQLKFKLLIISDYLTGNEETILDKYIKPEAREIIKKFRELGGHIITSGKSGYLLEKMGILPEGTYDNSFTLGTNNKNSENKIYGCQDIYKSTPGEQNDYLKELICLGYKNRSYITQTFTIKNMPSNFETLIELTNEEKSLIKKKDGYETVIEDKNQKYPYIVTSKEETGKGRIFLVNGSPIKNAYYFQNVRNMILYAMTNNIIYDLKIKYSPSNTAIEEDLPIPAGEEGVQLVAYFKLYNLADVDMTNIEINILLPNKIGLITNFHDDNNCEIENNENKYKDLNLTDFDKTKYIKCSFTSLPKLNSISKEFKLEILDYKITSKLNDIPLMYSKIKYTDAEINKEIITTPGIFYSQAAVAALLRGTINKDPTSTYPLEGFGRFFDLVLDVENKEATEARDVNYISLVPLVTPLFDGEDEGSVAKVVPLYENYYEEHNYNYPWKSVENRGVDYIDYAEVAGKGICYVADYDTPVKYSKVQRSSVTGVTKLFEPTGDIKFDETAGSDKATNVATLLKQIYFGDNDKFYETAAARTSLFINTATEKGAETLFGSQIPEEYKDPHHDKRAKVQYAFIRVDTYFYNSEFGQYQLPDGFNANLLISIDKFNQTKLAKSGTTLHDKKIEIVNEGHYDSTKERYNRLKPHEYSNSLRQLQFLKQYDPTNSEQLKELQELTKSKFYVSHFMVPIHDKNDINYADSILGFELDTNKNDGSGYLKEYPSVKFVKGHSIELILKPEITRLGGKAEFTLPSDVQFTVQDPVEGEESITTSADNVAFYKTEYDKENGIIVLYFKRGLMPNENYGQPSKCKVFLENLNKKENFKINLKIYALKYDFSSISLESYEEQKSEAKTLDASYIRFFSLPCLYIENKLTRKNSFSNEEHHEMYEYELMNPFARYGGYYQELTKHTAVYASAEAHHVKRPGFQSPSSGFSLLGNIGTSAIPAAEFLEHGKLAVPGVISTSRLEWSDIWGRKWVQNLRSVYPDIPVLPPVPLSYIMTTTYELITNDKKNKQERVLEWQSDESVYIRIQMKMRNTYKLYWEPTLCHANQKPIIKEKKSDYRNPIYSNYEYIPDISNYNDEYDVNLGFTAQYGICYNTSSYLGGEKVTESVLETIKEMTACSNTLDADEMTKCSKAFDEKYTNKNIPVISKRPDNPENDITPNEFWNYSPLIEEYLPDGYINSKKMWQLTIEDYSVDAFFKGYPFHLDNNLPNLDNEVKKPQALVQFPIFKGLGYNITYDKNYSLKKFKDYKGWWSDQLQNKDHSLIAGQQKVNQISVGQESLLKDSDWINARDLINTKHPDMPKDNLKNIYICQFNQNRVKVKPGQSKYAFLKNVYQNNVVPVLPDLTENDARYTEFDCSGDKAYQYSPKNISEVDNRVYTGNDRDWLYFAVALRSNARENINVILKMDPIEGSKYEGITKVQDGGRFIYWQPPDGPNSYQYYDGNINTVISKRIDLTMTQKLIPVGLYTFNTYAYQLFSIADKKEENREYTLNTYMNSHGYGDATTTVYVGGTDNTKCKVNPGEYTYVKITFYNNAGFDWKMKDDAITMNSEGYSLALNANSLIFGTVTAIQYPKEYKFMSYEIPKEIEEYITLTPSQHLKDISPQFFDLTFNNVKEIKDALEGDYYYVLTIKDTFPEKYKGKLWEIKMKLNEEYFYTLPGKNDPTDVNKVHDYHITIPSIKFGVPLSSGEHKGKIFYNLGQATDLYFTYKIHKNFEYRGVKIVNEKIINDLADAVSIEETKFDNLLKVWDSINNDPEISSKIKVTNETIENDNFYQLVTVNLTEAYPLFPYEVQENPFVTNISILVKTFADYVPYGYRNHLIQSKVYYNDGRKVKNEYAESPLYINCLASGPSLTVSFTHEIVELNETSSTFYEVESPTIFNGDTKFIKLTLTVKNEGTDTAYNPKFNLGIEPKAVYIPSTETGNSLTFDDKGIEEDYKKIVVNYDRQIAQADNLKFDLYFEMEIGEKIEVEIDNSNTNTRNLEESNKATLVKSLNITLCLTNTQCQEGDPNFGIERTGASHKIKYNTEQRAVGRIILKVENKGTELMPKYYLTAEVVGVNQNYDISTLQYSFKRKIRDRDERFIEIALTTENHIIDEPFKEGEVDKNKPYYITYKVIGEFPDGRTLDSLSQNEVSFEMIPEEEEEKNESIPVYAIVIIAIGGLGVISGSAFLLYKFILKRKDNMSEEEEKEKGFHSIKQRSQIEENNPKSTKRDIKNNNNIKIIGYEQ